MLQRFEGDVGQRLRLESLAAQKMLSGNRELAEQIDARIQLRLVRPDEILIEQGGTDNDIPLIFSGSLLAPIES